MSRFTARLATAAIASSVVMAALAVPAAAADGDSTEPSSTVVSSEPTPTAPPPVRLEEDNLKMSFQGTWRTTWTRLASGQTWVYSSRKGSTAYAYFEGTQVAWVARKTPSSGRVRVYVDGTAVATVDLYGPSWGSSSVVWTSEELADARHSVKIEVLGTKRAASTGTVVVMDAFEVTGSVVGADRSGTKINNGDSRLLRVGSWWTSTRSNALGGSAWRTNKLGSQAVVRFKGTGIAWIGRKDAHSGKAEVLLDGRRVAIVSQYHSEVAEKRVAFTMTGLPYGEHTLIVRALRSASSGSAVSVDVDAFLVKGQVLRAYRPTPFKYPWSTYIVIDKSSYRLHWVRNGLLIKSYRIAHGKASTPTPSRVWRISSKYYSDPRGVYGPRKMRLYRRVSTSRGYRYEYTRYLIHGTNQPWVIGSRASHGCIRMYNRDVLELWPQVPVGTMVVTRE